MTQEQPSETFNRMFANTLKNYALYATTDASKDSAYLTLKRCPMVVDYFSLDKISDAVDTVTTHVDLINFVLSELPVGGQTVSHKTALLDGSISVELDPCIKPTEVLLERLTTATRIDTPNQSVALVVYLTCRHLFRKEIKSPSTTKPVKRVACITQKTYSNSRTNAETRLYGRDLREFSTEALMTLRRLYLRDNESFNLKLNTSEFTPDIAMLTELNAVLTKRGAIPSDMDILRRAALITRITEWILVEHIVAGNDDRKERALKQLETLITNNPNRYTTDGDIFTITVNGDQRAQFWSEDEGGNASMIKVSINGADAVDVVTFLAKYKPD